VKNESEYAVHLQKDGVTESFLPGDEIPAWAARLIKNPLVTGDAVEEDGVVKEKEHRSPAKKAPAKAAPKADKADDEKADPDA
jgi:hypothetical protein